MILDPVYFIFVGPAILLSLYASWAVKSRFNHYSQVMAGSRMTGAQAARRMLDVNGLHDVRIEQVQGFLSDHYDPSHRTLRLSPEVFGSPSLSAVGVACHEAGHAMQHASGYAPLKLRSALVPATNITSKMSMPLILVGLLMSSGGGSNNMVLLAGVALFSVAVVFSLVTLPVEWDASARARREMVTAGIVSPREEGDAAAVLNAAFLTYLAAAASSVLTLLYYLHRAGLLGGRRD